MRDVTGFQGGIVYDTGKPDGTPRKVVDVSRINRLGWHAGTTLEAGIKSTYRWYLDNVARVRSGRDEYSRTLNEH